MRLLRYEGRRFLCQLKLLRVQFQQRGGDTQFILFLLLSTSPLPNNSVNEGGRSQNLILFIRGNAMSGAPSIRGTNQLPNPPIKIGITMKKIITKACAVTTTL